MASIKQRGLSFQAQVRRNGTPPISKCFKTITEARAWARQVEAEIDKGNSPLIKKRQSTVPTLFDAFSRYSAEVLPHKKCADKEHTFIRSWMTGPLGQKCLAQITPSDVSSFRDVELKRGKSPATVVRHLAVLSHLFTVATKEWGYSVENPTKLIRKPKVAVDSSVKLSQIPIEY